MKMKPERKAAWALGVVVLASSLLVAKPQSTQTAPAAAAPKVPELAADKKIEILKLQKEILQYNLQVQQLQQQYQTINQQQQAAQKELNDAITAAQKSAGDGWLFDAYSLTFTAVPKSLPSAPAAQGGKK